jgi:hypothetical protein
MKRVVNVVMLRVGSLGQLAAGPKAHYFFDWGRNPGSLVGGTMFFSRM